MLFCCLFSAIGSDDLLHKIQLLETDNLTKHCVMVINNIHDTDDTILKARLKIILD